MSEFDLGTPTPAVGDTPATPQPATPAVTPVAATPATTPAPATPGAVPEGYVPSYRLRETREAAIREAQVERQKVEAEWKARYEDSQRRLQALAGVAPDNRNPEVDAIRTQFSQLYPGLSKLEERAAQLMEMQERAHDLEAQNQHYWESHGRQTMDRLFQYAQESLGAPLTEEGKRQLHSSFVGFVQSSPELQARYASDPSLVQDFWKQFTASFIDPVRRTAQATVAGRAPGALPQDTPGGIPRTPVPQPGNIDDRVAAGWTLYNQSAK